ncbi:MAG: efflux RND transporter periplasmic adaptor subunit [Desulfobulbaceae bacterium]|uniref:Efflux RND transporter periplasmic adaptor subunit n=1 Tax=Candidatus Desulfobia pelagia TaxID=2841692 RepID=A0A8J6NF53_9BACT|nr:efflux RND transporter periplasmic adaptor subunit [Candidatus Desulfobia pelagia]
MKRLSRYFLWILVLLGCAGAVYYLTRPDPVAVAVKPVTRGVIESTVVNTKAGTVKACRRALLSPAIGGQIAFLAVHEGMQVKEGELLLSLWNEDLKAEVQLRESEIVASTERAEAACLNAAIAERQAVRVLKLQKQKAISEEEVDQAQTTAKARQADCQSSKADVQVSIASVLTIKTQLERTVVKAPFAGIIAEVNGEKGEYVTPSPLGIATLPVIDLVDTSCFYITAPIDEVDAPKVKVNMPARIILDAFGKRTFPGKVRRVADYVLDREKQARTVDIDVDYVDVKDMAGLMPGYSADAEVIIDVREDVLRIPSEAIFEDRRVLVFLPGNGMLQERTIEVGLENWDFTEVVSGLEKDDLVVVSIGREGVEDGVVAVIEESGK